MASPFARIPILSVLLLLPALSGCLGPAQADVLGTFYPMTFLVEEIAGDTVRTGQILKPGAEPHHWEPSVRDVSRIGGARLVVAQGLGFEPWLERILTGLGGEAPVVLRAAEEIGALPALDGDGAHAEHEEEHRDEHEEDHDHAAHDEEHGHEHGAEDPHTWLDPVLMARKAAVVEQALSAAFPEHAETFRANAAALIGRLEGLDAAFETRLASCATRHIVVQHDAFGYLAHRYGITVHPATGLSPEAEPNVPTVAALIETVRRENLSVVFAESATNPGVMGTIARETGAGVDVLSPLESLTDEERRAGMDYVNVMSRNLDALGVAMGCSSG